MRAFIIISCLALVSAAPQYNYNQPPSSAHSSAAASSGHLNLGLAPPVSAHSSAASQSYASPPSNQYLAPVAPAPQYSAPAAPQYSAPAPQYAAPVAPQYSAPAPQYSAPAAPQYSAPAPQYAAPVAPQYSAPAPQYSAPAAPQYSAPAPQYAAPSQQYQTSASGSHGFAAAPSHHQSTALVQKHIYVHVPPPDHEELASSRNQPQVQAQKHYKIIFIKAPSAPSYSSQLAQQQNLSEEKTLVYVLVKKPEGPEDVQAHQLVPPTQPSKPEVYFIKYKTQKEHQHGSGVIQNAPLPLGPAPSVQHHQISSAPSSLSGLSAASSGLDSSLLALGNSQASASSIIQPRQPSGAYGPPK